MSNHMVEVGPGGLPYIYIYIVIYRQVRTCDYMTRNEQSLVITHSSGWHVSLPMRAAASLCACCESLLKKSNSCTLLISELFRP